MVKVEWQCDIIRGIPGTVLSIEEEGDFEEEDQSKLN